MKHVLVDTDILSLFFREHHQVVDKFKKYLKEYESINFSIVTYYEILSGLKYRDAHKQLNHFLNFANYSNILPLTIQSISISGDIYANLRKTGYLIDDIDILIAGIALANNLVLVTGNEKHFQQIEELEIQNWSK
ncbi:MAG: VapC toxin family PIN domain ribonuclease [Candidatus Altiarchaeales archaeon HGW-Altiarchaeales-1]|nr:MAG: VapC toxin family PIN domain ribonuclease [Candidatus Altiarchaeales archaeon HGW-Altiarchaeales-1]